MQPPENVEPEKEKELCPECKSEVTFNEKDEGIEYWDCPKHGKINLKKEIWKKKFLEPSENKEDSKFQTVHTSCRFCQELHTEKCIEAPNPDFCLAYKKIHNLAMPTS